MNNRWKERIATWAYVLAILLFVGSMIAIAIAWDIWRWHTFQDLTNSDVGYWKWKFLIDTKPGK